MKTCVKKYLIILLLCITSASYGASKAYTDAVDAIVAGNATHAQKQLIIKEQKRQYKNESLITPPHNDNPKKSTGPRTTISSAPGGPRTTTSSPDNSAAPWKDIKDIKPHSVSGEIAERLLSPGPPVANSSTPAASSASPKKLSPGKVKYLKRMENIKKGGTSNSKYNKGNKARGRKALNRPLGPKPPAGPKVTQKEMATAVKDYIAIGNIAGIGRDFRKVVNDEMDLSTAAIKTTDTLTGGLITAVTTLGTKGSDLYATKSFKNFIQQQNVEHRAHQVGLELHKNGVNSDERKKIMAAMSKSDDSLLENKMQELSKQNININVPELKIEKGSGYFPGTFHQDPEGKYLFGVEGDDSGGSRIYEMAVGMGHTLYQAGENIIMLPIETLDDLVTIAGEHIQTKGTDLNTELTKIKNSYQKDEFRQKLIDEGANPEAVDAALEEMYETGLKTKLTDIKYELATAKKAAAEQAAAKKAAEEAAKKAAEEAANKEKDTDQPDDVADIKNDEPPAGDGDQPTDDPDNPDNNGEGDDVASSDDKKKKSDAPPDDGITDDNFDNISEEDMEKLFEDAVSDNKPDKTDNSKKKPDTSIAALQDAEDTPDFNDIDITDISDDNPDTTEIFTDKKNEKNIDVSKNAQNINIAVNEIDDASTAGDKTMYEIQNVVNQANIDARNDVDIALNKSNADYNENSFGNQLNTEVTAGIKTGFETAGTAIGTAIGEAAVRQSIRNKKHKEPQVNQPTPKTTKKKPHKNSKPSNKNNKSHQSAVASGHRWPVCPNCGKRHKPNRSTLTPAQQITASFLGGGKTDKKPTSKPPRTTKHHIDRSPNRPPPSGTRFNIKSSHAIPHNSQVQPTTTKKKTEVRHENSLGSVWYTDK